MRTSTLPAETGLPIFTTGSKSLGWLGLLFLMAVLGWCVGTLLYTYFYLRLYSTDVAAGQFALAGTARAGAGVWRHSVRCRRLRCGLVCLAPRAASGQHDRSWPWHAFCRRLFLDAAFRIMLNGLQFSPQTNAYGSVFYLLSWAVDVLVLIGLSLAAAALLRLWRETEHWRVFLKLAHANDSPLQLFRRRDGQHHLCHAIFVSPLHLKLKDSMRPPAQRISDVSRASLWFGLFGGAIAWTIHFMSAYAVAEFGCVGKVGERIYWNISLVAWLELALTALALLVAAAATAVAYRSQRRLLSSAPTRVSHAKQNDTRLAQACSPAAFSLSSYCSKAFRSSSTCAVAEFIMLADRR